MDTIKSALAQATVWVTLTVDRLTCHQAAYLGLFLTYGAPALGVEKTVCEQVALAFYLMLASRR